MTELPVWADVMLVRSAMRRKNVWHIRRGWSAYEGYETRCGLHIKRGQEQPAMAVGNPVTVVSGVDGTCELCEKRWRSAMHG